MPSGLAQAGDNDVADVVYVDDTYFLPPKWPCNAGSGAAVDDPWHLPSAKGACDPMPFVLSNNTRIGTAVQVALVARQCQGFEEDNQMIDTFHTMQAKLEATPHLLRLGRLFSETVLVQVGDDEIYLTFEKGHLVEVAAGPSRKTPWRFALRTDAEALAQFWQPLPAPGFHDIFGLLKIGRGSIDGDILCLVKNLRFFKEFMALPRAERKDAA